VTLHNGTDGQTDRRTDRQTDRVRRNMRPPPREEGRIISKYVRMLKSSNNQGSSGESLFSAVCTDRHSDNFAPYDLDF